MDDRGNNLIRMCPGNPPQGIPYSASQIMTGFGIRDFAHILSRRGSSRGRMVLRLMNAIKTTFPLLKKDFSQFRLNKDRQTMIARPRRCGLMGSLQCGGINRREGRCGQMSCDGPSLLMPEWKKLGIAMPVTHRKASVGPRRKGLSVQDKKNFAPTLGTCISRLVKISHLFLVHITLRFACRAMQAPNTRFRRQT